MVPPAEPKTEPGDLYIMGDHRLLCGDSTDENDVNRLVDGKTGTLFSTDPPYSVSYTGDNRPVKSKDWSNVYKETDEIFPLLDKVFKMWSPLVLANAAYYIWHADKKIREILQAFDQNKILFHQIIIWVKPTQTMTYNFYQWKHEPCAFGWKQGNKPKHSKDQYPSVWEVDWEGKSRVVGNEHPTQKPLQLFEIPMKMHTDPGDIVFEPFCGSGSQLIAAEKLGRRCFAMELVPAFCDVIVERWESATGKKSEIERKALAGVTDK